MDDTETRFIGVPAGPERDWHVVGGYKARLTFAEINELDEWAMGQPWYPELRKCSGLLQLVLRNAASFSSPEIEVARNCRDLIKVQREAFAAVRDKVAQIVARRTQARQRMQQFVRDLESAKSCANSQSNTGEAS